MISLWNESVLCFFPTLTKTLESLFSVWKKKINLICAKFKVVWMLSQSRSFPGLTCSAGLQAGLAHLVPKLLVLRGDGLAHRHEAAYRHADGLAHPLQGCLGALRLLGLVLVVDQGGDLQGDQNLFYSLKTVNANLIVQVVKKTKKQKKKKKRDFLMQICQELIINLWRVYNLQHYEIGMGGWGNRYCHKLLCCQSH